MTEQEQLEAQKRIWTRKQELKGRDKALPGPIEVVRKLHSEGRVPTDSLSKISAPPTMKAPSPMKTKPRTSTTELERLRALLAKVESLSQEEDEALRTALVITTLQVLVAEATTLITSLGR